MNTIRIGDKPIKEISQEDCLQVASLEGFCVCNLSQHESKIVSFNNTLFNDTVILEFYFKRNIDGVETSLMKFFFNHRGFTWHGNFDGRQVNGRSLKLETIKYLIEKGYDLPIY